MTRYLLDTNILSELIKRPSGVAAQKITTLKNDDFCTSVIVACELHYGVLKKGSRLLQNKVSQLLQSIDIIAFDSLIEPYYAKVRVDLEKQGTPIGANDLFIASHALALGAILVTANTKEFSRIPGLMIENWLE